MLPGSSQLLMPSLLRHPLFWLQIAHMRKEIDAIRVKDISQGGLTQGQQTQIARNEQRMAQVKF